MIERYDCIVVGAGMAGATAGYHLSAEARVLVLEMEDQPGYHTTGRSAAVYSEWYGNPVINGLTTGGKAFFLEPPGGFAEHPLLSPRGVLLIGREDQRTALDEAEESGRHLPTIRRLDRDQTLTLCPVLRPDYVSGAIFEPDAMDIDVHALHQGFLRGLRERGGRIVTDAKVEALARGGELWRVTSKAGSFEAPIVVDAAGAWADEVAQMAGVAPVGLEAKRRTAILFEPPADLEIGTWPAVIDVDEEFYFRPDAGKILGSPADETPQPPADAQADELDVALAVDRIERATSLRVGRIEHRWAGQRTFAPDKTPVVGFDAAAPGFFWFAGQGGYGIQTAPAMGRLAAALIGSRGVPDDLASLGITEIAVSPARFRPV
ncbi:MAG: FAD-binding oxidoreductase [Alphaproteobacteria bacterium]|jgi:D-arginine dehydrogenase|nr:FAD-binding oxidoreductase [Alphaproteobacteria bacterium]